MRERNTQHDPFVIERTYPAGTGTRLVFVERAVFLDGADTSTDGEQCTGELFARLGAALAREAATA